MRKQPEITKDELRDWLADKDEPSPKDETVQDTEAALLRFAEAHKQQPPAHLREKILGKLSQLNQQDKERRPLDLDRLPLLNAHSNWLDWQAAVAGISPPEAFEDIYLHELECNDTRELYVIWAKEYVEEEIHHDLLESFLILEGSCECRLTDEAGNSRSVHLRAGDFLTMQLGERHDLLITSAHPAKAILQRMKLAA